MKNVKSLAALLMVVVAGTAFAQRGRVGGGTPQVDTSKAVVVQGVVTAFEGGVGLGQPTLSVKADDGKDYAFILGPYRYLQKEGFAAAAGDQVRVTAYPCAQCPSGLAPAQVVNLSRNLTLDLRGADGVPLWMQPQAGGGYRGSQQGGLRQGSGTGVCTGQGLNLAQAQTFEGTVKAFTGGAGQKNPVLTLDSAAGTVEIVLSPYRALAKAGYTPTVGSTVRVTAAPCVEDGRWVALSLQDLASGLVIRLRNDAGQPTRR